MPRTSRSDSRLFVFWLVCLAILLVSAFVLYLVWPSSKPSTTKSKKPTTSTWNKKRSLVPVAAVAVKDSGKAHTLLRAINRSLVYLSRVPSRRTFHFGTRKVTRQEMLDTLLDIKQKVVTWGLSPRFYTYLKNHYQFYKSAAPKVLFTGYYEASLRGSLRKTKRYRYPLYRKPKDLYRVHLRKFPFARKGVKLPRRVRARLTKKKEIVPYYTRKEIDTKKKLAGRNLELVWIDDPVGVFFLHIQGSGLIQLENGGIMRVNYADQNGHPYVAIGKTMLQKKMLERGKVSMQSIRAYLNKHPKHQEAIFNSNPSYIFFRKVKNGPIGSLGVPVTSFRSIATDRRLFPRGALCFVTTQLPNFNKQGAKQGAKSWSGLVLNQDTGGAIRGPGRVDLFTGRGAYSEQVAGHLQAHGSLYFLLKKKQKPAPRLRKAPATSRPTQRRTW
ncbi:MAG: murein transglycosylase [Deltaproteobacteria bacterium]|nr:MAG: murein transglycosylase [Deltaproteobacteria bacterium]